MRSLLLCLLLSLAARPVLAATPDAIHDAIAAGRCREAAADATASLEEGGPPAVQRLLGDALQCLGETRPAALAYRRYLETVGPDPTAEAQLRGLREQLGRLLVTVTTDRGEPAGVWAEGAAGEREEGHRMGPAGWLIADLDPAQRPLVGVAGPGLETVRIRAPALAAGGQTALELRTRWVGVATVELLRAPAPGVSAEVDGSIPPTALRPGEPAEVSPGAVAVALTSPHGRVLVPLRLAAGGAARVDPLPWTPTALTLSGVPAGASVRLFLEQVDPPMERVIETPAGFGEVDEEWGVRLAPALALDSLVGGDGTLVVSHPTLGVVAMELLLEAGAENAVEVDWRSLEAVAAVRTDHAAWRARRDAARTRNTAPVIVGLSVGVGGAIASAVGWAAAGANQATLQDAQVQALSGAPHPDGPEGWYLAHGEALEAQRAAAGAGVAGAILGAAGFTIGGVFGATGRRAVAAVGDWTPP
jgi:hypothetical protein